MGGRGATQAAVLGKRGTERVLISDLCTGCTGCVSVCPVEAIQVMVDGIMADQDKCVSCGYCAALCPVQAIRINRMA